MPVFITQKGILAPLKEIPVFCSFFEITFLGKYILALSNVQIFKIYKNHEFFYIPHVLFMWERKNLTLSKGFWLLNI